MELASDFSCMYTNLVACRNTREMTPCSLINSEMIGTPRTPGSTTRSSHSSHHRVKAPPVQAVPSSREMNEYFAAEQRRQQQAFIDKYGSLMYSVNELHNLLSILDSLEIILMVHSAFLDDALH